VPIRSCPARARGIADTWIGVGLSYPALVMLAFKRESRLNWSKFIKIIILVFRSQADVRGIERRSKVTAAETAG
jgi:hypothetical protein